MKIKIIDDKIHIDLRHHTMFGIKRYYPHPDCELSKLIIKLKDVQCLTQDDLEHLQKSGIVINLTKKPTKQEGN